MSHRVQKKRHRKTDQATALSISIRERGCEIMPCTRCFTLDLSCFLAQGSTRCSECVRLKIPCDGTDVGSALARNLEVQQELEKEEEELENQLSSLAARLARIKRTRRSLRDRETQLFNRGMMEEEAQLLAFSPPGPSTQTAPSVPHVAPPPEHDSFFDWTSVPPGWPDQDFANGSAAFAGGTAPDSHLTPGLPPDPVADPSRCSPPLVVQGSSDGTPPTSQGS
ncbi:hypothetical protein QBC36DRAFT_341594 [Triangularia setosa]|uniref:Zn(2)-C6 fungal-type domain-containing protein n=1 Tax=Triangularia setosa TaxID=2587417 RepID=A0AAN6VXI7_9PEZI|nr:hypothetical protein QBC36DRAFT_341594 [Podospora setosa]